MGERATDALLAEWRQASMVPYSDGHSGNTFGGAVALGVRVALGREV